MKKLNLQLGSIKEMLTKEQMKKITGGYGTTCKMYCCPDSGSCASAVAKNYAHTCYSNEGCQSWAISQGATCSSGFYIAALCV